ncbi:MAG: hypothetical protein ACPGGL_08425, partial [Phycisphaerales bacterium]
MKDLKSILEENFRDSDERQSLLEEFLALSYSIKGEYGPRVIGRNARSCLEETMYFIASERPEDNLD